MVSDTGIILNKVGKTFTVRGEAIHALEDLSLEIRGGEFFCIVGPSGCGKTTLLRILAGLESSTAGEVIITTAASEGKPVNSMVFQEQSIFPWLSVQGIQTTPIGLVP